MNHYNEDKLLEYLLETSDDLAQRTEIAEHLAACPECRKKLDDLRGEVEIIGSVRPLRSTLQIPRRQVRPSLFYRALRTAAILAIGVAAGLVGARWANPQPSVVSPAYIALSPPPDSISGYAVPDATAIPGEE